MSGAYFSLSVAIALPSLGGVMRVCGNHPEFELTGFKEPVLVAVSAAVSAARVSQPCDTQ